MVKGLYCDESDTVWWILQAHEDELQSHEPLMQDALHEGEVLISHGNPDSNKITDRITYINKLWSNLKMLAENRKQQLLAARDYHQVLA